MSTFEFTAVDRLVKEMDDYTFDKIAPKMVKEAAPILESKIKEKAAGHKDSGNMAMSIKPTSCKKTKDGDGYYITVRPTGKDSKRPVRNMAKMAYLEFGTRKQKKTPVISAAISESQNSIISKMQEVFNREAKK